MEFVEIYNNPSLAKAVEDRTYGFEKTLDDNIVMENNRTGGFGAEFDDRKEWWGKSFGITARFFFVLGILGMLGMVVHVMEIKKKGFEARQFLIGKLLEETEGFDDALTGKRMIYEHED